MRVYTEGWVSHCWCPHCGWGEQRILARTRFGLFVECTACRRRWLADKADARR